MTFEACFRAVLGRMQAWGLILCPFILFIPVIVDSWSMGLPKVARTARSKLARDFGRSLTTAAVVATLAPLTAQAAKVVTPEEYQAALTDLYAVGLVMKPAKSWIEKQEYDRARSDVKYCLDQLGLQKKVTMVIQNCMDYVDDPDTVEDALGAASNIANTAIQLDGTIYTLVFIPPAEDGERPPNALKYVKEADDYYDAFFSDLEKLKALGSDDQRAKARSDADSKAKGFPVKLFQ